MEQLEEPLVSRGKLYFGKPEGLSRELEPQDLIGEIQGGGGTHGEEFHRTVMIHGIRLLSIGESSTTNASFKH